MLGHIFQKVTYFSYELFIEFVYQMPKAQVSKANDCSSFKCSDTKPVCRFQKTSHSPPGVRAGISNGMHYVLTMQPTQLVTQMSQFSFPLPIMNVMNQ